MKKLLFILFCFVILTIIFLFIVLILNRDDGRGALQITSSPSKSKVYLDGDFIGETPICKCKPEQMLAVGQYTVKIVPNDSNVQTFEQRIQINSSVLTVVDRGFAIGTGSSGSVIYLTSISDKKDAQLMVISFPGKAKILLDNNDSGVTPLLIKNLTASDHEIKLTRDGFFDKIVKIRTVAGFRLEIDIFLGIKDLSISDILLSSSSATLKRDQIEILSTPTGFLRVRSDSTLNSSESGRVIPGEKYDIVAQKDNWYQIKIKDGTLGWVSSQYAKKL